MKKFSIIVLIVVIAAISLVGNTEENQDPREFTIDLDGFTLYNGFIPTGIGLKASYRSNLFHEALQTDLLAALNFAVLKNETLYRYSDGSPVFSIEAFEPENFQFSSSQLALRLGLAQDLCSKGLLQAYLTYHPYLSLLSKTSEEAEPYVGNNRFSDIGLYLEHGFITGVSFSNIHDSQTGLKEGFEANTYIHAVPAFLNHPVLDENLDISSAYLRTGLHAHAYFPLFSQYGKEEALNWSVFLANRFLFDWLLPPSENSGSAMPSSVAKYMDPFRKLAGLGGTVRGFESHAFDALLKLANNMELRGYGPALFAGSFKPVGLFFLDAGYYNSFYTGFGRALDAESGLLVSVGAGFGFDVFGFAQLGYQLAYVLEGQRLDGATLSHGLLMFLHF